MITSISNSHPFNPIRQTSQPDPQTDQPDPRTDQPDPQTDQPDPQTDRPDLQTDRPDLQTDPCHDSGLAGTDIRIDSCFMERNIYFYARGIVIY
jgi:hypothetical protein